MDYDYLIIGAGLAGCACACRLARAGARALVVDRADLGEKDKLCGGLLTPRAVRELRALYGEVGVDKTAADGPALGEGAAVNDEADDANFQSFAKDESPDRTPATRPSSCPNARVVPAALEGLVRSEHTRMRVLFGAHDQTLGGVSVRGTWRRELDRYALEQAIAAGADVWDGARVADLDLRGHCARISRDSSTDGAPNPACEVTYGALVAADGAHSWVRREACRQFGERPAQRRGGRYVPRFARPRAAQLVPSLEAYVEPSGAILTGKYCSQLRGYGWYIPCGDGANIGFDGAPGTTRAQLRAELETFAREVGVTVDDARLRGAFIPSGGSVLLELYGAAAGEKAAVGLDGAADSGAAASSGIAAHESAAAHAAHAARGSIARDGRQRSAPAASSGVRAPLVSFIGDAAGLAAPATGEGIYFALRSARLYARAATSGVASYRSLMSAEAAALERQHAMLGLLFDERVMEGVISVSHATGLGSGRAAKLALKLFASF